MLHEKLKQAAWQFPLLVITACMIGFAVNDLRPDGIPFVGNWSEEARINDAAGKSLVINLAEAERLDCVAASRSTDRIWRLMP